MSKRKLVPEDLLRLSFVSDVAIHPSGESAVCCVKTVRAPGAYRSRIHRISRGGETVPLTHGDDMDVKPRWSPDGTKFAFLSNRKKPLSQFFIMDLGGGEARCISELAEGSIGNYEWSPDGKTIAFLYRPKSEDRLTSSAESRKREERSDPPTIVTRWPYRLDGDGMFNDEQWALYLLDVSNGVHSKILGGQESEDIEFSWLKSGDKLAVIYRTGESRYLEPPDNELFILDTVSGNKTHVPTSRSTKFCPSISPDGTQLAYMFHDRTTDPFGPKRTRVGILKFDSMTVNELDLGCDVSLDALVTGDARDPGEPRLYWGGVGQLWTTVANRGSLQLAEIALTGGMIVHDLPARGELHLGGISDDRKTVSGWMLTPTAAPEACFINLGIQIPKLEIATSFNSWLKSEIELSDPTEIWLDSPNGESFQAWILKPEIQNGRAAIEVHGGPAALYSCAFMFEMQLLASNGFTVFFSNPHGSAGYGEKFVRSILGNWGELDWQDVQVLTNYAKNYAGVDPTKVCILGGSYGGFMVNWAISHSQEYFRAITDRCVSNLMSKWGNSDYLFVPDGNWPGCVFKDTSVLWECSPIKHFANVKTPTMIIHSEGDLRCPIEQGEQVYAALKILGVETQFVRYPLSTSHGLSRNGPPDLRVHRLRCILDWLQR